ncbi:Phage integrase family protein [Rhizobiales bacterium GAS191]|nr:Phage integrase family protein [Rhizobiales bacterium GAS191]
MRVLLKGVHKVRSKGHTYYYAWRGGPRITALPGTPAFITEYQAAHAVRRQPAQNCLFTLIAEFRQSAEFGSLRERSRQDYKTYLKTVEEKFGTMPLKLVELPAARGVFKEWRDSFAANPRKADHLWTALRRVLSFGKDRGKLSVNVCERGGRLYKANRQDKIWTDAQVAAFLQVASPELRLALQLALWTGQRQGDLLTVTWSAIDQGRLNLRQSKSQAFVSVPLGAPLRATMEEASRKALTILTNSDGQPWSRDGFRSSWRKAWKKAGVMGVTFHDLRGTAVTRLAQAECTVPQIAAITGHSLKDAQAILDAHYLGESVELADAAMRKLETRTHVVKPGVKP